MVYVNAFDSVYQTHLGLLFLPGVPRKGDFVLINAIKHEVKEVVWVPDAEPVRLLVTRL